MSNIKILHKITLWENNTVKQLYLKIKTKMIIVVISPIKFKIKEDPN
jgi:hypothetical protein